MEDGQYMLPSLVTYSKGLIYEILEIYITKKLQELQAIKRQAVLQGIDSRWNRA